MPGHSGTRPRLTCRGAELEAAILGAAWEQLTAEGAEHLTVDTVAAPPRPPER